VGSKGKRHLEGTQPQESLACPPHAVQRQDRSPRQEGEARVVERHNLALCQKPGGGGTRGWGQEGGGDGPREGGWGVGVSGERDRGARGLHVAWKVRCTDSSHELEGLHVA
jgi:hypothetical protein